MIIYHGSDKIIEKPKYGLGKINNDYGQGFYCTEDIELAREWACKDYRGGFVNAYSLNTEGLRLLKLDEGSVIEWLAILLENRNIRYSSPVERKTAEYIIGNFLPKYKTYDVIKGYRADDSYFSYARAFLANTISIKQLSYSMKLGKLGLQVFLQSKTAFGHLSFVEAEMVSGEIYYQKRNERDRLAREQFNKVLEEDVTDGIYARDILKGGLKADELCV